ncbi:hypothetical protein F383_35609 [Gossypium arboreum]|uniref:Uncharacterized protein n=1 Tax=Gossypium arboreum TaxID=29729 RepID=A0A0B0NBC9_GOSAR|nr:hypothetical protein F383_35609 [Gossypium arboreum]
MPLSQKGSYSHTYIGVTYRTMPMSQTWSYSHTYIGVTYRCQHIKCGLTRTHISESYVMTYVS